jgi:hypothetical protein
VSEVDWETRARRAEAALEDVRREKADLWEEVQKLRAERREVEYHEKLAAQMADSVSWRITAPLRAAKRRSLRKPG